MFKGLKREKRKKIDTFRIDLCRVDVRTREAGEGGRRPVDDGQMPLV